MALIEYSPAVQEVPGSIPRCDATFSDAGSMQKDVDGSGPAST
jgi:hypothetical protein